MKHSIRTTAAIVLAAAATIALPVAAQADTIYPPSDACSIVPPVITAGGTVDFSCDTETFGANEPVTITVEGATSVEIGFVKFAVTTTGSATSTAEGALPAVPITFPSNATGVYNITAVSATSAGGTSSVSIASAAGGGDDGLAVTGFDNASLLGIWVGGGALLLAGGALAVATAVRRNRKAVEV